MSSPQQQPSPPPSPETAQAAQVALALLVSAALMKLWPNLLAGASLPRFRAEVVTEVRDHARASQALASRQYRRARSAAGETTAYRATVATLPSVEDIGRMVDEALAGVDLTDDNAVAEAKARLARGAEDAVFDTGARTILENVGRDRAARGYARIPEPDACAFCLLLATRGAVYKADRKGRGDSFAASNAKFTDGKLPSSIKVHDNCRCHPEPVFGAYEPPARVREAEALYIAVTRGYSGAAARKRFRQAVEGRLPTT